MKKIICCLLAIIMMFSMSNIAFAASPDDMQIPVTIDQETEITIIVPSEYASEIGDAEIESLIDGEIFNNGDVITIQEIGYVPSIEEPDIQPLLFETYETDIWWRGNEWEAQNYFVISAARGQTTTLSSKFSRTLTTGITAGEAYVTAEIGASVTVEYDVTHVFTGPPEGSVYNSREFRVQFYAQTVRFNQYKYDMWGNLDGIKSGTANVPTRYLMYNIDRVI